MTERALLKKCLLDMLVEEFASEGFKLSRSVPEFTQKTKWGWRKLQLIFLTRSEGWTIAPVIMIRFNEVEKLYHQISNFETRDQRSTPTIGSRIERLKKSDDTLASFDLKKLTDLEHVHDLVLDCLYNYALPYYERYDTLQSIDHCLNDDPTDLSSTGPIYKGIKGVIASKLTARENHEEIVKAYTEYYTNFADGFYLKQYQKVVDLLEQTCDSGGRANKT